MADEKCPVHGCTRPKLHNVFCCGPHWLQIPSPFLDALINAKGDEALRVAELAALQELNAKQPPEAKVARG